MRIVQIQKRSTFWLQRTYLVHLQLGDPFTAHILLEVLYYNVEKFSAFGITKDDDHASFCVYDIHNFNNTRMINLKENVRECDMQYF